MSDDGQYHGSGNLVHVGRDWVFEIDQLWANIDQIEADGIASLVEIAAALNDNWPATVTALAFKNIATLYTLIAEASR